MSLSGVHRRSLVRLLAALALALAVLLVAPSARASSASPSGAERDAAVDAMVRGLGVEPDEAARRL